MGLRRDPKDSVDDDGSFDADEIRRIREAEVERIRKELERETESERQIRLWSEGNAKMARE